MALTISSTKKDGAGKLQIAVVGATPDEVTGPEARKLTEQRAIAELGNNSVFLEVLQPPAVALNEARHPVTDRREKVACYGAVYEYKS